MQKYHKNFNKLSKLDEILSFVTFSDRIKQKIIKNSKFRYMLTRKNKFAYKLDGFDKYPAKKIKY